MRFAAEHPDDWEQRFENWLHSADDYRDQDERLLAEEKWD